MARLLRSVGLDDASEFRRMMDSELCMREKRRKACAGAKIYWVQYAIER